MSARSSQRNSAFARAALAAALGLGLVIASDAHGAEPWDRPEDQPTAHELQLARTMFELSRAYQLSRGPSASPVPPALDSYGPRVVVEDGPTMLARITGRRPTSPEQEATMPSAEQLFIRGIAAGYTRLTNGIGCCPCLTALDCSDQVYCNGAESCQNSICAVGAAPCVDGDPCTTDECLESFLTCLNNPVPPPADVARLDLSLVQPGSAVARLRWTDVAGAIDYNVYRGERVALGDLACFISHLPATGADDDGAVPGPLYVYLVTAFACGESTLGSANPGTRPLPPGCP